ncbi:MAG TPA: molybdenum cofactor biosynthesis protein MoaE [Pseudomonadales bacterium]
MHLDVRVQTGDFDVAGEYAALRGRLPPGAGAVASFVGLVRDVAPAAGAEPVRALYLEHYPGMTERSIRAIAGQAQQRWPLLDLVVIHRVGRLEPTEQIVFVQAAASHRAAAFAACEFVMDYLKTDAVFWKREDTDAGGRWVEATRDDRRRVNAWAGAPDDG